MTSVAVCTPHSNLTSPSFFRFVLNMQNAWPQHQFFHVDIEMEIVGKARNQLVEAAQAAKVDVIWFVDNDVMVPQQAGQLIDQAMQLGVVSGMYWNRRPPYTPQCYLLASEPEHKGMYWPMLEYPETLFKCDAVGAGCLAIKASIFDELTELFKVEQQSRDKARALLLDLEPFRFGVLDSWIVESLYDRPAMSPWFEFTDRKGEDLYFCENVKKLGYEIWVEPQVKCKHLGYIPIEEGHFTFLRNQGLIQRVGSNYEALATQSS